MKFKSLIFPFLIAILGCTFFNDSSKPHNQKGKAEVTGRQQIVQIFKLGTQGTTLELIRDESENSISLQTKRNDYFISKVGRGNSEFVENENGSVKIDTLFFTKNKVSYLITSYIKGSTYGAECYFMIYKNTEWIVMALPFDRARFYDVDRDGLEEIIGYKSQVDSTIYTFNAGLLLPKKI